MPAKRPGHAVQLHSADAAAATWDPPSDPRHARQSADPCPSCGGITHASPRSTVRVCPACQTRATPPGVLAPYQRNGHAAARQVKSQRERDLEALGLARRKGVMLGQLAALAADDRLDPASLPVVEWFREQVKDAASDGRLDELAALLPEAAIQRRRWWQGQPAAITAGYADEDDEPDDGEDDDEDQADEHEAPLATPASIAGQQWRSQPAQMTWADALAACGWRLAPTVGGCQVVDLGRLCAAEITNSITGGWVCGDHYLALCRVIYEARRRA
jgi:hypothetical protein